MQCYSELTPPTAVTHSLSLPFTSAKATNLIVAKTSLLQIYNIKTINAGTRASTQDDLSGTTKLVLVAEYPLSGTVISMVRVKTLESKSGGEAILLGFRDAKLSLVEWDPERYGLSTLSIHYYEQDEVEGSPWASSLGDCVNYLVCDPGSRCAALKFGARSLAILPFRQGDDDTAMDDWDEELDGPRPETKTNGITNDGDGHESSSSPSFVLRFSSLDPSLLHPIHLTFLYEYRDPTFGILSSSITQSSSLTSERKDRLSYMVFTLDLHQKASTTILAVSGLPYDLFKIIALPAPVGGVVLVGGNEIIHIDQSGKSNGLAVNSFAKQCTSFGLADQAGLELRLEGCTTQMLDENSGDMLFILNSGELCVLSFKLDGRTVSGLSLRRVSQESGGLSVQAGPTCVSALSHNAVFVGSEDADSVVLGWTRQTRQVRGRRPQPKIEADDIDMEDEDDEDDDDDDLYGEAPVKKIVATNGGASGSDGKSGDYVFRVHDSLLNIAPLRDVTYSKPYQEDSEGRDDSVVADLRLVASCGRGKAGSIVVVQREIEPSIIGRFEFPEARGIWTMSAKKPMSKTKGSNTNDEHGLEAQFDRLMIVSQATNNSSEESAVYALTSAGFEALTGTEFEPAAGWTIEAGTIGNGMRVIQVLRSEVRSYDGDLGLAQILPMFDEETGAEPKIISASIADPYILLIRDDSSIYVAQCDSDNELEELEREDDTFLTVEWLSGCLYTDRVGVFANIQTDKGVKDGENIIMFLLSAAGALYVYALPDMSKPIYVAEGMSFIPPTISPDYVSRRMAARETLTEILVADLGDSISTSPYLILRAANDDLTIYEPFRTSSSEPLSKALNLVKIHNPHLAQNPEVSAIESADDFEKQNCPMRAIRDLGGYSTVFLPGESPSFILKTSTSAPKMINLRGTGVRGISSFHTAGCDRGFIYIDTNGIARVSQLPSDARFDLGLLTKKIPLGNDISGITYHHDTDCFVAGTSAMEPFELPKDDEQHREWQKEDTSFRPLVERGILKLISPSNWSVIDTVELDPYEVVMCIKTLGLEISENSHERRQLITVGTAVTRGEDLPVKGCVYVYDIVTVVPEPDRPETNKKMKLIAKEEIPRGAVTGVSEIGTQGFMIIAQGQKCMVRGLKEDGTLLPVAFMDMNTYVTSVRELPGTGLCVLGDALKGVWLAGYTEEPYKMHLFGKQGHNMEVTSAEILPLGEQLYIVVADADCNLHILQFDPEHPKSLQGQLLLHRTTFALGHFPSTMTVLPRTKAATVLPASAISTAFDETNPERELLVTTTSGSIMLLSPLTEAQYRRLSTLANHLFNTLYHACGLNPKAYRIDTRAPEAVIGGRHVVDGSIVMRFMELGRQRRSELAGRVGVDVEQIREDLLALQSGIAYI